MHTIFQKIKVEETELHCVFHRDSPVVMCHGGAYTSLCALIWALPILSDADQLASLAKVSTFFSRGLEFLYIADIAAFQEDYRHRMEADQFDFMPVSFGGEKGGIFDVSVMHPPRILEKCLVFFVESDHTHSPYKVTFSLPFQERICEALYEPLPLLNASVNSSINTCTGISSRVF